MLTLGNKRKRNKVVHNFMIIRKDKRKNKGGIARTPQRKSWEAEKENRCKPARSSSNVGIMLGAQLSRPIPLLLFLAKDSYASLSVFRGEPEAEEEAEDCSKLFLLIFVNREDDGLPALSTATTSVK
jgi:hypothetical protein